MYAASWSGGKDCCLALYKALQAGYNVQVLANFYSERYERVRFHGTPIALIGDQARAMGLDLLQWSTPDETYEEAFLAGLRVLVDGGVTGIVFGDIYPEAHREWGRRMCAEVGVEAVHPIFGMDTQQVMAEFLAAGFEAVVISGRPDLFSGEQMGARLGPEFLAWCAERPGLDVCGENGEYHTVVVDGPLFRQRIELTDAEPCQVNGHWFVDIRAWELRGKPWFQLECSPVSRGHSSE
jgi:uncharacterized protein (TIGR00290 family)